MKTIAQNGLIEAEQLTDLFRKQFGGTEDVRLFQAPARVNLIGEHTDYNDGFVMPAAIDFHTWVAAAPRDDLLLVVHSVEFGETEKFNLTTDSQTPKKHWSDYVAGVAFELRNAGIPVSGASLLVHGNVPLGSGLSSSASLEMATAYALTSLAGADPDRDRTQLALLCQRAENHFVGARCGIMDQFIAAHGQVEHALMLDCRSLQYELLPLPRGISLVICNTMVKHELASGEYNTRRRQCEEGAARLRGALPGIRALRDVRPEQLEHNAELLPREIYKRCRHVVTENERVLQMAAALRDSNLAAVGRLMFDSHQSLRDDYQVSCNELDAMVDIASALPGVIGARMTGGGFGGCTINLVEDDKVKTFRGAVAAEYQRRTGTVPEVYVTKASDGASELTDGASHSRTEEHA